ncbi:MAG: tetratricopeptide repeat protein [Verrucomicrobiota bacterium]
MNFRSALPVSAFGLILGGSPIISGQASGQGTPLPGLSQKLPGSEKTPSTAPANPGPDLPALQKAAAAGDAAAQLTLANLIFSGNVKDAKPEDAAVLLEKSADSGHAPAQYALARFLQSGGAGVKADPERAKFLIQQAAESGHAPAQSAYGTLLMEQIDLKARDISFAEPLQWFRKAADQAEPAGMCRLGMMIAAGQGAEADPAAGWKWIAKAAQTGHPFALNEAGICLQQGLGVEKDPTAAIGYFHAAADQGNTAAMVNLGNCYRFGVGIPLDLNKAGAAFAAAAKANFGPGQLLLGELFERGEGTTANPMNAAINYLRAAANGIPAGKERFEALKPKLSKSQIQEAEAALKSGGAASPAAPPAR